MSRFWSERPLLQNWQLVQDVGGRRASISARTLACQILYCLTSVSGDFLGTTFVGFWHHIHRRSSGAWGSGFACRQVPRNGSTFGAPMAPFLPWEMPVPCSRSGENEGSFFHWSWAVGSHVASLHDHLLSRSAHVSLRKISSRTSRYQTSSSGSSRCSQLHQNQDGLITNHACSMQVVLWETMSWLILPTIFWPDTFLGGKSFPWKSSGL